MFKIGARQPIRDWHLGHLYQPRAYTPDSNMPPYPFLFTVKDAKEAESKGQQALVLPPAYAPNVGQVVVPSPQPLGVVDSGQEEF